MQNKPFPNYVNKYFWGDDLSGLSLENNENYILQTILNIGDQRAVKWLLLFRDRSFIKKKLSVLKLTPQSANFWNMYLS